MENKFLCLVIASCTFLAFARVRSYEAREKRNFPQTVGIDKQKHGRFIWQVMESWSEMSKLNVLVFRSEIC